MDICKEALRLIKDLVINTSYEGIDTHMVIPHKHIPKIDILDNWFKLREGAVKNTFYYDYITEIYIYKINKSLKGSFILFKNKC